MYVTTVFKRLLYLYVCFVASEILASGGGPAADPCVSTSLITDFKPEIELVEPDIEDSWLGQLLPYKLTVKLPDEAAECERRLQVDISSITPVIEYCVDYSVSYDSSQKMSLSERNEYACPGDCLSNSSCSSFSFHFLSTGQQCIMYSKEDEKNLTVMDKSELTKSLRFYFKRDCTVEFYYDHPPSPDADFFGPSFVHLFDTEYSFSNSSEVVFTKPMGPNINHRVNTDVWIDKEGTMEFMAMPSKSNDFCADWDWRYSSPKQMITAGVKIEESYVWVRVHEMDTLRAPLTAWNPGYPIQDKIVLETSMPEGTWDVYPGASKLLSLKIKLIQPHCDFKFKIASEVFQDPVYFGKPVVNFYGILKINKPELLSIWKYAPSGNLTHRGWTIQFGDMHCPNACFNQYQCDSTNYNEDDYMTIDIPLTFMGFRKDEVLILHWFKRINFIVWLRGKLAHKSLVILKETTEPSVSPTPLAIHNVTLVSPENNIITHLVTLSASTESVRLNIFLTCPEGSGLHPTDIKLVDEDPEYFGYIVNPANISGIGSSQISADFGKFHNLKGDTNLLKLHTMIEIDINNSAKEDHKCTLSVEDGDTEDLLVQTKPVEPKNGLSFGFFKKDLHGAMSRGREFGADIAVRVDRRLYQDINVHLDTVGQTAGHYLRVCSMEVVFVSRSLICPNIPQSVLLYGATVLGSTAASIHFPRLGAINMPNRAYFLNDYIRIRSVFENAVRPDRSHERRTFDIKLTVTHKDEVIHEETMIQETNTNQQLSSLETVKLGCLQHRMLQIRERRFCVAMKSASTGASHCAKMGGYLSDVRPSEWITLQNQLFNFRLGGNLILTSGEVVMLKNGTLGLKWANTGEYFRISPDGILKPEVNTHLVLEENMNVVLGLHNAYTTYAYLDGARMFLNTSTDSAPPFYLCAFDGHEELFGGVKHWRDGRRLQTLSKNGIGMFKHTMQLVPGVIRHLNVTLSVDRDSGSGPRICRVKILHLGRNFPCVSKETKGVITNFNTTQYTYYNDVERSTATISFDSLQDWGDKGYQQGPDRHQSSIEIGFYIDTAFTTLAKINLTSTFSYFNKGYRAANTNNLFYDVKDTSTTVWNDDLSFPVEVTPLDGTMSAVKNSCKRIRLTFFTKSSLNFWPALENLGFNEGHHVTWCGMYISEVGENFPCYKNYDGLPMRYCEPDECKVRDEVGTVLYWRTMYMRTVALQYYETVDYEEGTLVEFELSVRVADFVQNGTVIPFKFSFCENNYEVYNEPPSSCPSSLKDVFFELQVEEFDPEDVENSTEPTKIQQTVRNLFDQPNIDCKSADPSSLDVRERSWVQLHFEMPYDSTVHFQLQVNTETKQNRSILHITDVKFCNTEQGFEANILGMDDTIDIRSVYNAFFYQSEELTTESQVDSLYVDFGHVTHPSVHRNWHGYAWFNALGCIKVEVELSDHPDAADGTTTDLHAYITMGNQSSTCSMPITINRTATVEERKNFSRPFYEINMTINNLDNMTEEGKISSDSVLEITALICHTNDSLGEGYPATIKFILDGYSSVNISSIELNYTRGVSWDFLDSPRESGSFKLVFENGIMFPDVIELNFSVSLDINNRRTWSSSEMSSILATSSCNFAPFDGYPASSSPSTTCSILHRLDIELINPVCETEIEIRDPPCQIQSNVVLSDSPEHAAYNIINQSLAWSAPIRTGPRWEPYVQVDFLTILHITKIMVGFPLSARGPTQVRVDHSVNSDDFTTGETVSISFDKSLRLKKEIVARVIRLVVTETNDATPNLKAISINSVQFFGCNLTGESDSISQRTGAASSKGTSHCAHNKEISSNHTSKYRHFAVDTEHGIIYVCDVGQYRENRVCYSTTNFGITWTGLPIYIDHLLGYSSDTGRVYMADANSKAYFSSFDGVRIESTQWNDGSVTALPGWQAAVGVPGNPVNELSGSWYDSSVVATFSGLVYGGRMILNWESCCLKD